MQLGSDLQASFQVLPAASILNGVTSIVFSNFHFTSSKPTNRYCDQINRVFLHVLEKSDICPLFIEQSLCMFMLNILLLPGPSIQ